MHMITGPGSEFTPMYIGDPVIGRWNVIDPLAEKYYSTSSYSYVENNPMVFTDPNGMEKNSTHTDKFGNVLAVYDDGDLGVYKHGAAVDQRDIDRNRASSGLTSGRGEKMGESLHSLSFADQSLYNSTGKVKKANIKIDFGSEELTTKVSGILDDRPSLKKYASMAGTGGDWDLKSNTRRGSLLFGKYASPRDAGNFAAGAIAQASGIEPIVQFGFGAYNLTGNSTKATKALAINQAVLTYVNPVIGLGSSYLIGRFGEDKLTQRSIDLGKRYIKNK